MLSPDPVTQAPENGQNYDRYTYAFNNPLKYSDPSGYTVKDGVSVGPGGTSGGMPGNGGRSAKAYAEWYAANGGSTFLDYLEGRISEEDIRAEHERTRREANGCIGGLALAPGACASPVPTQQTGDGPQPGDIAITISVDGDQHFYEISGVICAITSPGCDEAYADSVFAQVNGNDVPFSVDDVGTGPKLLDPPIGPDQPIFHQELPGERTSVNTTVEGHIFHPGNVSHTVKFVNGNLVYTVTGTGSGRCFGLPYCSVLNNVAGVPLFLPGVIQVINENAF